MIEREGGKRGFLGQNGEEGADVVSGECATYLFTRVERPILRYLARQMRELSRHSYF